MFRRWLRPSLADLTFCLWAAVIAVGFNHRLLNTDGDPAWHLRFGRAMLERGEVLRVHTFSHTAYGRGFVPMEWLSEVAFALAERAGGLAGVAIFTALLLATTFTLVLVFLQWRGVDALLAYLVTTVAAILTSPHWAARPHVFTLLATALLLPLLANPTARRVWLFLPLFALWANLHGGYLFGLGLIGVHGIAAAGDALRSGSPEARARVRLHGAALGLALLGTLANPSGPRLIVAQARHLADPVVTAMTQEFASPDFHRTTGLIFLAVLLAVLAALGSGRVRLRSEAACTLLALTALALMSQRNIPLFGVAALPAIAPDLDRAWRDLRSRPLLHVRRVFATDDARGRRGPWAAAAILALLALAGARGQLLGFPLVPDRFDPRVFPVTAVERARAAGLGGRLFNDFAWGGYVLWAWPEQKVFIDGYTAFYGAELAETYLDVAGLAPGWRAELDRRGITLVLMPTDSRLARALPKEAGWTIWYRDGTATLLARRPPPEPPRAGTPAEALP